jgi:hypothetical protein
MERRVTASTPNNLLSAMKRLNTHRAHLFAGGHSARKYVRQSVAATQDHSAGAHAETRPLAPRARGVIYMHRFIVRNFIRHYKYMHRMFGS